MNFSKAAKALLLTLFLSTTVTLAQQQMQMPQVQPADSVSDQELEMFVDVAMDIQGIKVEADSMIMDKLDEEGMSQQRFRQIMMSQQNPNAPQVDLTTEEQETLKVMQSFLQDVSMKAQQQQLAAIQESEMSQQRFQSIAMALQQDKDLAMRFQEMAQEMETDS
jgi:hypothetical protein